MAPSRSTPRMMQVTRAAFQAQANLNEQATDPMSHTLVRTFYTRFSSVLLPAKFDGRPCLPVCIQHLTPMPRFEIKATVHKQAERETRGDALSPEKP